MKKTALLSVLLPLAAFAGIWDGAELRGTTDKDPVGYTPGEDMVFSINLLGVDAAAIPAGAKVAWTRTGDDGATVKGEAAAADLVANPLVITTSIDRPGFVRVVAELLDENGEKARQPKKPGQWWDNAIAFDGGAGAAIDRLGSQPEPADFDDYWKRQKARLAEVPVKATRVELPYKDPAVRLYAVSVDCAGPRPVTGFLSIPADASADKRYPARANFQGYGTNIPHAPGWCPSDTIQFEVNAHGFDLEKDDAYYKEFFDSIHPQGYSYGFSPEENKNPDTAYFNGMALRVMRAFDYLKSLPEWNGRDLVANGGSQGGLQTMWAAGLVEGLSAAYPSVPWCCDLAGGKAGRLVAPWHIPYVPAIDYYDPVNHAKRVPASCRVDITRAGLGDYTCPPSGVATLYNNLHAGKVSILWVQGSTHGYVPPEPRQTTRLEK